MTVKEYLQGLINKDKTNVLRNTITGLGLEDIEVNKFKKRFGEMNPEKMKDFILESANAFQIGLWAFAQEEYILSADEKGYGLDGKRPEAPRYGEYTDR